MADVSPTRPRVFVFLTGPLLIYELAFALYVIYFTLPESTWFVLSYIATVIAFFTALLRIRLHYLRWHTSTGAERKKHIRCFWFHNLALAIYIIALGVQAGNIGIYAPPASHLIIILMAAPPVIALVMYLLMLDTTGSKKGQ